jgi:hypothetical protein
LVYVQHKAIVLGEINLTLDGEYPLIHVVVGFRAQNVLSIFIFNLEAKLLILGGIIEEIDLRVAQDDDVQVEVFIS